jgi:hypothetical protein
MLPGGEKAGRAASSYTPSMRHSAAKYITRVEKDERISSQPRCDRLTQAFLHVIPESLARGPRLPLWHEDSFDGDESLLDRR